MCVCVCVWVKYFLCAFPPYPNSQNTHTTHPHTHTDRRIKTAYKKDRNKRFVRLLYSSNSIYVCILFSNFFDFSKIFCFPATVQIKSRKMLPEQKTIIYTEFAHNCFFESPCLCSVVSCRKSVKDTIKEGGLLYVRWLRLWMICWCCFRIELVAACW